MTSGPFGGPRPFTSPDTIKYIFGCENLKKRQEERLEGMLGMTSVDEGNISVEIYPERGGLIVDTGLTSISMDEIKRRERVIRGNIESLGIDVQSRMLTTESEVRQDNYD